MQETANGAEKIDGVAGDFFFSGAVFPSVFLAVGDLAEPCGGLVVAETSGGVFYVVLEMIDGVAVTGVALFSEFGKFGQQKWARLFFGACKDFLGEAFEEFLIACKETAVKKRE